MENKEVKDAIIRMAIRQPFGATRKFIFNGSQEQEVPEDGVSLFEMAVLMAMQGYCQFSTHQPKPTLIEMIAKASLQTAKETINLMEVEKERLFPVNDNLDDIPF